MNDYSTAVRIFEGLSASPLSRFRSRRHAQRRSSPGSAARLCRVRGARSSTDALFSFPRAEEKVENATQYQQYVTETKPLREELGVLLKEELCASPLSLFRSSSSRRKARC